jgi:hypothetical protein
MARGLVAVVVALVSAFALTVTAFEVVVYGDPLAVTPLLITYGAATLLAIGALRGNTAASRWLGLMLALAAAAHATVTLYWAILGVHQPAAEFLVTALLASMSLGVLCTPKGKTWMEGPHNNEMQRTKHG